MTTVLIQIEACLNSRPLSTIPNEPENEVLTPAHFLIGEPLVTRPDYNYENENVTYFFSEVAIHATNGTKLLAKMVSGISYQIPTQVSMGNSIVTA